MTFFDADWETEYTTIIDAEGEPGFGKASEQPRICVVIWDCDDLCAWDSVMEIHHCTADDWPGHLIEEVLNSVPCNEIE